MSYRYRLVVYSVSNQGSVTQLDTLELEGLAAEPRVDRQTGWVYIPCMSRGVCVVRYNGSKLVPVTTLKCVTWCDSLAVVSTNTLYVCDSERDAVYLVDVPQDMVTDRLHKPQEVMGLKACCLAVLGGTVLVKYGRSPWACWGEADPRLVIYRHGIPTPGKLIPWPHGLGDVPRLTSDHHSSFLLPNYKSRSVYVLGYRW